MTQSERNTQARVAALLSRPDSYPFPVDRVDRIETHGALVFLAGPEVYKIKRQVKFTYMDFSTLDLRKRSCEREIAINKPHAPDIYLDVVAITEEADGRLVLSGPGVPVEWAVRMRRFEQDDLLATRVELGPLDPRIYTRLADAVCAFHESATVACPHDSVLQMSAILHDIVAALRASRLFGRKQQLESLERICAAEIGNTRHILGRRAGGGLVRRCHGDLHLGNVVLWKGEPVLFDAIEFDDRLATIDVLYDLAFLLMDLDHHGGRAGSNAVLNRYLWRSQRMLDLEGLSALPLFLALRAGVRAMVTVQRAEQDPNYQDDAIERAGAYLDRAFGYLAPQSARLIAIGGLSGTGKSTLAAALAPCIASIMGAVHLRSDLERKAMFGCDENERLPASAYTPETTSKVYAILADKAAAVLVSGHPVIVDAVYAREDERGAIERVARSLKTAFRGLWLEAPSETLIDRVGARRGDASDATPEVVARQLRYDIGALSWTRIAAGGGPDATLDLALHCLAGPNKKSQNPPGA